MILEFLKNFILFTDVLIFTHTLYLLYVIIYKFISPEHVYIISDKRINYYTDILYNNLYNNIKCISEIENLNMVYNANEIRHIGIDWILNKRERLYETMNCYTYFDRNHNIKNDIKRMSTFITEYINHKLKHYNYNTRLVYESDGYNGHFYSVDIHRYILKYSNNITLYEVEADIYILYNRDLYNFINMMTFETNDISVDYLDMFDIWGKYIKIHTNENKYLNKKYIKILISSYYKDYCYYSCMGDDKYIGSYETMENNTSGILSADLEYTSSENE
jgi:hypothetical protein